MSNPYYTEDLDICTSSCNNIRKVKKEEGKTNYTKNKTKNTGYWLDLKVKESLMLSYTEACKPVKTLLI